MTDRPSMPAPRLLFLASVLIAILGYALAALAIVLGRGILPAALPWLAVAAYAALLALLAALYLASGALLPEFPALLARWTARNGLLWFEGWGLIAGIAAAVVCGLFLPHLLAFAVLAALGFLAMAAVEPEPVPPEEPRSLYRPPQVPEEQFETGLPSLRRRPQEAPEGVEIRDFSWQVRWPGSNEVASQSLWLPIVLARLEEFRRKNPYRSERPPGSINFHDFVTNGITGEVLHAAAAIAAETQRQHWSPFHELCNVLAFVQSFRYESDEATAGAADYFRYPIETLYDGCGDCEDLSILAAALLKTLGHDVVMLLIPPREGESGHVAIGVAAQGFPAQDAQVRQRYLYCETTAAGWHVGQVPDAYQGADIQVHPV